MSTPIGTVESLDDDGGFVVPVSVELIEDYLRYAEMPLWSFMFKPESWEERLADAIEERRIGTRIRRFRGLWSDRITTAIDVLRGEHYCE
jgi:hypothetical protein